MNGGDKLPGNHDWNTIQMDGRNLDKGGKRMNVSQLLELVLKLPQDATVYFGGKDGEVLLTVDEVIREDHDEGGYSVVLYTDQARVGLFE